ncbi:rCG27477 [Rattus norvegicus]|uniref:RCG27477 n=1 Tax=Rattus norvegicus TaxID=10116 RepID=A6KUM1_RAT|nr:rCG27477 [Rattus norvegicus]
MYHCPPALVLCILSCILDTFIFIIKRI